MTFRRFIYWCTLCGGWAALLGWVLGRMAAPSSLMMQAGVKGLFLGMLVALGLGLVDAAWTLSGRQVGQGLLRTSLAVLVGTVGGLIGGMIGQLFYGMTDLSLFLIFGWTITGLLIGASIGAFEIWVGLARHQNVGAARRKIVNGLLGGTAGGLLGGLLSVLLKGIWGHLFRHKPLEVLWSPSSIGFVALGMCIGLMFGLAQVLLRQAWVRVEAGFRAGREMILSKAETTIGRAEVSDIGLFGDPAVEPTHARILLQGNGYVLVDAGTQTGTFVNDTRVIEPAPLKSGDLIRVGHNILRFGERHHRSSNPGS